jgi:hypothetical protein
MWTPASRRSYFFRAACDGSAMASLPSVLPYRTDADEMRRFIAARVRGRTPEQIRSLGFSAKSYEGTASSAEAMGLLEDKNGAASALGRRLALAEPHHLAEVVCDVVLGYPPYSLLVESVLMGGGPVPTPLEWIEMWWATHGFGTSESNRAEAAPVFARLVETAGFGTFVQGRKGHPSRVEWSAGAAALLMHRAVAVGDRRAGVVEDAESEVQPRREGTIHSSPAGKTPDPDDEPPRVAPDRRAANLLQWEIAPGRSLRLSLPPRLSAAEKRHILRVLQVLLEE